MAKRVRVQEFTVPPLEEPLKYHAFLSHSKHSNTDIAVVNKIRTRLEGDGFIVCDVENDFNPAVLIDININNCIRSSNKVVFIVSKEFMKSSYMTLEIGIAVYKQGTSRKVSILTVVTDADIDDLPVTIRRHNVLTWGNNPDKPKDTNFWNKFITELCSDKPSTSIVTGDFFHGLAWSYFYGYLKLVLPGLRDRVSECQLYKDGTIPFLDKMMIILPDSGFCPSNLNEDDKNLEFMTHIEFKASRAGNVDRSYKSSVYKVTDPETKKQCYIIPEFATPLMSMYEMEEGQIADLSNEEKLAQKRLFEAKLSEILEHENNAKCNGRYVFLSFKDPRKKYYSEDDVKKEKPMFKPDGWSLSKYIAHRAFAELDLEEQVEKTIEIIGRKSF